MTSFLAAKMPELDFETRTALIAGANGIPAAAIANAELDMAAIDAALDGLATTGDPTNALRSQLAQSLSPKAALPRYEALLQRVPAYIARKARTAEGPALDTALTAWTNARALSQIAIPQSLVAETVVFEMAGYVAALAPPRGSAKA